MFDPPGLRLGEGRRLYTRDAAMIYDRRATTMAQSHRSRALPSVQSMTAFARREACHPWGSLSWEIRSVNHRYLEAQLRLPEAARHLEMPARELLREKLVRGKLDCTLRLQTASTAAGPIAIDDALVRSLDKACLHVEALTGGLARPGALELLRWPGVIAESHPDVDEVARAALALLRETLDELVAMRAREGANLAEFIAKRLDAIDSIADTVRRALPELLAAQQQKLAARVAELCAEVDPQRLEQEIALLAARSDVAEELDRLASHVAEARRSLAGGAACGRRLDFLMQEFNREANTLSSKSMAADTTRSAVELKVLIEQIREQVQNIE
jgi:uncharacterized protein (TIGR00255 family)